MRTEKTAGTANSILTALLGANEYVALGLQVGELVIPLVKGAIMKIKSIGAPQETVTYQILLQVDGAELDAEDALAIDDLIAINAEFAKRGIPQLPVPPAPPVTQ